MEKARIEEYLSVGINFAELGVNSNKPHKEGTFDYVRDRNDILNHEGNLAVLTGDISKLVVLDFDLHDEGKNGLENFKEFLNYNHVELPKTMVIKTPRNGLHYYYRLPSEWIGKLFKKNVKGLEGVDFQTTGAYVVAEGSTVPNGTYERISGDIYEIPYCPEWLLKLYFNNEAMTMNKVRKLNALGKFIENVALGQDEGGRNVWLTSIAGQIFASGATLDNQKKMVYAINQSFIEPPLPTKEVTAIIKSLEKREERRQAK